MAKLILASTSPARRAMLAAAGLDVEIVAPQVDEAAIHRSSPSGLARTLALAKARAVASRVGADRWVIGADQVVVDPDSGTAWGKPPTVEAHGARLRSLRGRSHRLVTAFAVVSQAFEVVGHRSTDLEMRADITDDEIDAYVASGDGTACAGGYTVEGGGAFLFQQVRGDWNTVLGLPLFDLFDALRAHGWRYGEAHG